MKNLLFTLLFFLLLTIVFTYPTICAMSSSFFGDPKWTFDSKGSIYSIWLTKYQWLNNIPFAFNPLLNYPFGVDMVSRPSQWGLGMPLLVLSLMKDEIFSFNVFILTSFVLAGIIVYLFVKYIIGSSEGGLIAGLIYSFCPYHSLKAFSHLGLAAIQWIPLFVFSLIILEEKKSYKASLLCAISFVVVTISSYYYGYITAIVAVLFFIVKLLSRRFGGIKYYFAAFLVAIIAILPFVANEIKYIILSGPEKNIVAGISYVRPYLDLFKYSAKISDYFRPSEYHPIFGKIDFWFIKPYSSASRHWAEKTLYVGMLPAILAVIGLFLRKQKNNSMIKTFLVLTACVAFLFSLSPEIKIGRASIFMPSYFMYKIFPMFRCPARFGVLVILCISVLAGVGVKESLSKILSRTKKNIIVILAVGIIMFEFMVIPPFRNVDLTDIPESILWLRKLKEEDIIVEYPLVPDTDSLLHDKYCFYQRIHGKRIINGAAAGSLADAFRIECVDLLKTETLSLLAYLGAKYIIINKEYYREDILKRLSVCSGMKLIKDFNDVLIFKLLAPQKDMPVMFWHNIGSLEKWDDNNFWRWIGNKAIIWIGNGRLKCRYGNNNRYGGKIVDIGFRILSFAKNRDLEIYVNGILIKKLKVLSCSSPRFAKRIRLKNVLLKSGENIIEFYTPDGETKIGDVLNKNDSRRVSFGLSDFEIMPR